MLLADGPADVRSLCASLYHLADGVSPFAAPRVGGVVKRILDDDPAPLTRSDAPAALDELVRAGLSKDPAGRPDSAGELARSLQDIQVVLGHPVTVVPLRISDRHERSGDRPTGPDESRDGFVPRPPPDSDPEVDPVAATDSRRWSSRWVGAALAVVIVALVTYALVGLL